MDGVTTSEVPELKLHFLDYWRVIRLRRSLIVMVFLLCVVTSTLLTFWLPKQYASTVRIEVQKDTPEIPVADAGGRVNSFGSDPYFLTTQFKIIESWSILTNVIANLHLDEKLATQAGDSTPWNMDKTYAALFNKISVDQTRMTSLIEISVKNSDPKLAADIANAIVDAYRDSRLQKWKGDRYSGITVLQDDLAQDETKLGNMETNLNELRASLQISDLDENSAAVASTTIETEQLREYQHEETMALTDYLEYSNILAHIAQIPTNELGDSLNTAFAHQTDPELSELSLRLAAARDHVSAAENEYGPKHTEYLTAQKQLDQAQHDFDAKVSGIVTGLKQRVEIDRVNMEEVQRLKADLETRRNELAQKDQPYFSLKRNIEELRRNNEELNRTIQREVAEVGQPMSIVIVRDPARPVMRPVSPKTFVIIPFGIVVGLIVGISLAFFIEYLDTSVKTIDDVERALQAPVLGVIPQNIGNLLEEGAETPHAEAYRVLRTNILFSRKNENWNTISVLSGGAGEGKSTTLFNLAVVFAQNGQKVLVVDSDLRRPSIHRLLHLQNTIGLTDFLLKQRGLDEIIQKTKMPTLDFIASGKLPSSSMSILGSPQMKETIQELKRRYEYIFFDSPPLLGVSDASILASEMDMVLQVIQYRRYPQPMTIRAKQMILKVGGNLVGIVLNNINMSQDESYYYYSGYYEYGQQKDKTVVQLSDAAKTDIKQKY
jgi:capsular exopolysaccharide synthesis family protein